MGRGRKREERETKRKRERERERAIMISMLVAFFIIKIIHNFVITHKAICCK